jgi:UDP-N-acetylmuramoyl-tripeptide--D-alanyl-D-alanine ligase
LLAAFEFNTWLDHWNLKDIMTSVLTGLIALVWLIGTYIRVFRQARFYQIEEYMSLRYARWWLAERDRWLPARPAAAWLVGAALASVLSEGGDLVPGALSLILAVVAVYPPRESEIKKPFRRTPRATRLLGTAFVIATVVIVLCLWLVSRLPLANVTALNFVVIGFIGLLVFLTAPVMLMAANLLMTPVEALFRQQFVRQAKRVLAEVHPVVIGITGSYGKTTTKTFLAEILNGRYKTYATPKSYNTMMGVCMAINNDLKNDYSVEYFIVEMGAYIQGEIQRICALTPPQISIVVEVGLQHLERFGSLENTAAAKYEIIKALPPDGVGVFNWDNSYVRQMYERGYPAARIAVTKTVAPDAVPSGGPRFVAHEIQESLDGLTFAVTDIESGASQMFRTKILGQHNVINILLATAVAVHEGMSLRDVAARVSLLQPPESRLAHQTTPEGITIINDAYSANPEGIVSALRVLAMHRTGKRLLITPGMVELGDLMERENRKLGEIAAGSATDVILVGEKQAQPIRAGLQGAGFPAEHVQVVETLSQAVDWYQRHLRRGDTVLFLNDLPDIY